MSHILVVDDDKSIRFLLSELLRKDHHTVGAAADGSEAINVLETEHFDLVVTDLHMARLGGIDVLRKAKESDPLTEVLILTGHGTISSAVEAMQLGAFVYLTKPIDLQEFRMKVQQGLERRQLRLEVARQKEELQSHQEMIARDLKLAEQVQRSLVPPSVTEDLFEIAVRYMPMIGVGGDFSDIYYNGENEIYITIVDVTGHGITAALLVNRICMEIRRLVREQLEPNAILYHLNDFILHSFMGTGMFLTMFSSVINLKIGSFQYAGSAHPAAILWRSENSRFEMLESQNPIIGFDKASKSRFQQDTTVMQPGDKLLLYTDGIIEIEDKNNRPLGITGLINLIRPAIYLSTHDVADNIIAGLKRYAHSAQRDDVYLVALGLRNDNS